jgi:hypothetical protein
VRWHVTVAVGNTAESSATDTFLRQLPKYTLPVFVGYGSDLRLSNIRLTIEAPWEDDASQQALEAVSRACAVVGWTEKPAVRRVDQVG